MDVSGLSEWMLAVNSFHAEWFPDVVAVQPFWFGARKRTMRAYFLDLANKYEAAVMALLRAAACRPLGFGGALTPLTSWPPRALGRLRLRAAVFLDQMSRNIAAVRGNQSPGIADFKAGCDAAALVLALSVVADLGTPICGASLLASGTAAELCFLSLVLRHSRLPQFIATASHILHALSAELVRLKAQALREDGSQIRDALDLCGRFLSETEDAALAVKVDSYLIGALSSDEPLLVAGLDGLPPPRLDVLDERCRQLSRSDVAFLDPLLRDDVPARFLQHHLVAALRSSLDELGLLDSSCGLVLSLSGGVDSMVTACLLWLLSKQLPSDRRFQWCALHLCHPNRQDAVDEEGWVRWVCNRLGASLFIYRLQIRRPHGNLRTGISRERYEEKSKELRFRMYARCLVRLRVHSGAILLAHHQDDADENRLAELGKGNIIHIDGMTRRSTMLGVEVIRPLLQVRKAQLIDFADDAGLCYMQDSTPKWSRRGWTRRLLDEVAARDAAQHRLLVDALASAGAASGSFGEVLDCSLHGWVCGNIVVRTVWDANGLDHASGDAVLEVGVVFLRLPEIIQLAKDFEARLAALCADFADIEEVWNAAINAHTKDTSGRAPSPCDDELYAEEATEDNDGAAPGMCPLQHITVCTSKLDAGPFLLGRAISAASNVEAQVQTVLQGQLATRRALTHLWDCVARARREYQWGTLHKRCPCLYLKESQCLVLCNAVGRDEDFMDRRWQHRFANAVLAMADGLW